MTVNTNTVIVNPTAITYPAVPQVIFGSPRKLCIANDHDTAIIWCSFDGVTDAVRLQPAAGFADTGIYFDDLYTQVWVRLDSGSAGALDVEVQVLGEEVAT